MYDLAAEQFKNFVSAYPSTANGIEARFYLGLTQMKLSRFEDARMTFQNFALAYVDHPKSADAWIKVAEAFLALKNDREAASAYERVKVFHPGSPLAPDALLSAAQIYLRLGERENATRIYRSIVSDYPSSRLSFRPPDPCGIQGRRWSDGPGTTGSAASERKQRTGRSACSGAVSHRHTENVCQLVR